MEIVLWEIAQLRCQTTFWSKHGLSKEMFKGFTWTVNSSGYLKKKKLVKIYIYT